MSSMTGGWLNRCSSWVHKANGMQLAVWCTPAKMVYISLLAFDWKFVFDSSIRAIHSSHIALSCGLQGTRSQLVINITVTSLWPPRYSHLAKTRLSHIVHLIVVVWRVGGFLVPLTYIHFQPSHNVQSHKIRILYYIPNHLFGEFFHILVGGGGGGGGVGGGGGGYACMFLFVDLWVSFIFAKVFTKFWCMLSVLNHIFFLDIYLYYNHPL